MRRSDLTPTEPSPAPPVCSLRMRSKTLILALLPLLVSCEGWRLERAGHSKCERGTELVLRGVETAGRSPLPDAVRKEALTDLNKGMILLREGMSSFAKASEKTGQNYDVQRYLEALKMARMKVMELRD